MCVVHTFFFFSFFSFFDLRCFLDFRRSSPLLSSLLSSRLRPIRPRQHLTVCRKLPKRTRNPYHTDHSRRPTSQGWAPLPLLAPQPCRMARTSSSCPPWRPPPFVRWGAPGPSAQCVPCRCRCHSTRSSTRTSGATLEKTLRASRLFRRWHTLYEAAVPQGVAFRQPYHRRVVRSRQASASQWESATAVAPGARSEGAAAVLATPISA
jgi:hypothetical protein